MIPSKNVGSYEYADFYCICNPVAIMTPLILEACYLVSFNDQKHWTFILALCLGFELESTRTVSCSALVLL